MQTTESIIKQLNDKGLKCTLEVKINWFLLRGEDGNDIIVRECEMQFQMCLNLIKKGFDLGLQYKN